MTSRKNFTLYNEFHGTEAVIRPDQHGRLTLFQIRNANKTLCGFKDCLCSGPLGTRSSRTPEIEYEHDRRSGKLIGACIPLLDQTNRGN